ncbi:MAG TPA: methyltransferase domain-containing protein [Solirubrobacteraceae bacterium]|jgi:SAM-dependent methyltransferase|nr:methyltransferase domain-containing protein [Solirubrobacteraceae bacterium]
MSDGERDMSAGGFDANAHRDASRQGWEEAAAGWVRSQDQIRAFAAPVSHWMLDAVAPQPGQRVLELAAGLGETGLLAAELVAPVGGVVISDQADAMLAGARERAAELGLANVEFQTINAEWIDLPVATVDIVLCRWGYMLMVDPAAALGETRRVLRPGGRAALAVWDAIERNPWAELPALELGERNLALPPAPGRPGPFALGRAERVHELLEQAGFADVRVESLELHRRHTCFDEFWETMLDLSRLTHDAVLSRPQDEIEDVKAALKRRFACYERADGSLDIPARTLVAAASA